MLREKVIRILKSNKTMYSLLLKIFIKSNKIVQSNRIISKTIAFLSGKPEVFFTNKSIINYCKEKNCLLEILEKKMSRPVLCPSEFPINKEKLLLCYESPEVYYALISNALIWGDNDCISCENSVLDDRFLYPYSDEIKFETGACHHKDNQSSLLTVNRVKRIIDEGIFLVGQASNNWYHWVFDVLSRMVYINSHSELKDVPLIIDETIKNRPSHLHLLRLVDDNAHRIIYIRRNTSYTVKKLHYFSRNSWSAVYNIVNNNKSNPARFIKSFIPIQCYRNHVLPLISNKRSIHKNIFISRPDNATKRLVNEKELSLIASAYGFFVYEPSQDSIEEQARMFNSADFIIAGEGAALVNLIWCKQGSDLACIICDEWNDYNYSTIAYMCGVNCNYLITNDLGNLKHVFNPDLFEMYLKERGFFKQK